MTSKRANAALTSTRARGNLDDQDQKLSDAGGLRAVEQATDASQVVKSSRGILLDLSDAEYQSAAYEGAVSSTLVGDSDSELPPSFEEAISATAGSQASSSKGGGGFMSSLQHSFKAMTAAMRPKPEPFVSPLCQAAARGDIQQVRGFLAEGANINGRNENGNTALISAVLMNRIDAAKFLLTAGADHTVKDSGRKCKPPFFHAIDVGATVIIELLLARGVDVNERNVYGQPYFVDAINTGDLDIIKLLLTRGANVNTTDISGSSILAIAIKKGNQRLVQLFLEFGADANSRDLTGQPVVILAFSHGRNDIVTQLLSRGSDPNARSITGTPFVIEALNKNDTRLVEDLLARGANSNAQDPMGVKMLSLVVNNKVISEEDREKLLKILLSHGANPNETDSWGKPALLLAVVASSNTRILKMFLEHGANPNAKSATDETFLINFMDQGNWERVKLFLQYGANPNEGDKLGRTPLILALQKGKIDVVQLLIQHGVDVNKTASISPLAFVHATGNTRVEQLLRQHGANGPVDDIVVAQEPSTAPGRAESPSPPGYDAHDSTTRIL